MNKTNPVISIFLTLLLLNSCGSIAEGLSGSKKKGSDEFLIEKKAPLVLPPNFGELPKPKISITKKNDSSIEEIIRQSSSTEISKANKNLDSSVEKSIIEKINEQ